MIEPGGIEAAVRSELYDELAFIGKRLVEPGPAGRDQSTIAFDLKRMEFIVVALPSLPIPTHMKAGGVKRAITVRNSNTARTSPVRPAATMRPFASRASALNRSSGRALSPEKPEKLLRSVLEPWATIKPSRSGPAPTMSPKLLSSSPSSK